MADKDTVMKGFIIQPLKMKSGNQCFSERVYVATIVDDMLLGHDLLHHLGVCLDMRTDTLILKEEQIPVTTNFNNNILTVARVSVNHKVRLPLNTRSEKQHQSIGRASSSPVFHRQNYQHPDIGRTYSSPVFYIEAEFPVSRHWKDF